MPLSNFRTVMLSIDSMIALQSITSAERVHVTKMGLAQDAFIFGSFLTAYDAVR
jgi:hypothetical protein